MFILYLCKCHAFIFEKKFDVFDHPEMETCPLGVSRNTRGRCDWSTWMEKVREATRGGPSVGGFDFY